MVTTHGINDLIRGLLVYPSRLAGTWARAALTILCLFMSVPWISHAVAQDTSPGFNALEKIGFVSLPGSRLQIEFTLSQAPSAPRSFTIEEPARIALDFDNTVNKLDKRVLTIGTGMVTTATAVEARGRTRVVLNLVKQVPYDIKVEDNRVYLILEGGKSGIAASSQLPPVAGLMQKGDGVESKVHRITKVDFRRGEQGEGRVVINLSDAAASVDLRQEGDKIVVQFINVSLPKEMEQRLDVIDFATPVTTIDTFAQAGDVKVVIAALGDYEHLAYQTDEQFTVEVSPRVVTEEELLAADAEGAYTGEKLSLNFQNIEVRAALQLIADFTGLNMVTSDTVAGSITLRLKSVPWDQALDLILKTKGLGMRQMGNVILVAPAEEIAAREKQELEANAQIKELEPLRSELVQINYAKATDIASLLKAQENSLLSTRGNVTVDERTNTLLVQDTAAKLAEMRSLISKLDIPVRQVMIESRIVIASSSFNKDIGARFGVTAVAENGNDGIFATSGSVGATDAMALDANANILSTGQATPVAIPSQGDRLNVDLPVASAGQIAFAILGSDYLVDLELSAMQAEGSAEVVSSPRVITANQKQATVEQGVEIPYESATSSGATSISFKKATLSLKVTPQITPDERILLDLAVHKDSQGEETRDGPTINTRQVITQVLIENGETVVLGGIYEETESKGKTSVPLLGDLPLIGALFRSNIRSTSKEELLIFVTPKILSDNLKLN